ncbi:MAG: glycosyltransferase family 4 protein [Firmicutes bacterium]|nr:glycosyltransferase family 4 protein [Bacillota bacterium]MDD4264100.1 glycosyltransferase family 4 protein [Bacillota bacterium]MDD4692873.1 glycosyltransferase family 4 protein [Bacillota bacterium]
MHVLLVNVLFLGGQTTHSLELGVGLKKHGIDVSFLLFGEAEYPLLAKEFRQVMLENQIPVYTRKTAREVLPKVDLLHAHSSWTFQLVLKWQKEYKIPVVFTIHGLGIKHDKRLEEADGIIAVGKRTKDSLPDSVKQRTVIITNGVDLTKYVPKASKVLNSPLKVLYAGRLSKKKETGLLALAEAASLLKLELLVATDYQVPLGPNCEYLGWQENILPVLRDVDIIFACGRALREGMAIGLASGVLGERYYGFITSGELFVENIDLSGLTGAVPTQTIIWQDLLHLKDPSYLKKCQSAARKLVGKYYSLDQMVEETVKVYERCLL